MRPDTLVVLALVVGAAVFLVRRAFRAARRPVGPGCDRCGH